MMCDDVAEPEHIHFETFMLLRRAFAIIMGVAFARLAEDQDQPKAKMGTSLQVGFQLAISIVYFILIWRWRPFKDEPLKITVGGKSIRFDVFNDAALVSSALVIFAEVVALLIVSAGGDWMCSNTDDPAQSSRKPCTGTEEGECGLEERCTVQWTPEWDALIQSVAGVLGALIAGFMIALLVHIVFVCNPKSIMKPFLAQVFEPLDPKHILSVKMLKMRNYIKIIF